MTSTVCTQSVFARGDDELKPTPIEVWLSQRNMEVTGMVVHDDETTENFDLDSLTLRGAQREITGTLIRYGYTPTRRWETEGEADETVRRFRLASKPDA